MSSTKKVERLNHSDNYRRIGELWVSKPERGPKEQASIFALNEIVQDPNRERGFGVSKGAD